MDSPHASLLSSFFEPSIRKETIELCQKHVGSRQFFDVHIEEWKSASFCDHMKEFANPTCSECRLHWAALAEAHEVLTAEKASFIFISNTGPQWSSGFSPSLEVNYYRHQEGAISKRTIKYELYTLDRKTPLVHRPCKYLTRTC
jgi:hypothetical protein